MRSMTGYGSGSAPLAEGRVLIEIRALNHKHQDVRLRVPTELGEHASFLEQLARTVLGRGRYDVAVRTEGQTGANPQIDAAKLRAVYLSLATLRDELAPGTELSLAELASLPDVVTSQGPDASLARKALTEAFSSAHRELDQMRDTEGATLKDDLSTRLKLVQELRGQVHGASRELVEHHRTRLNERLSQLLEGPNQLSPGRLEQEIALVADRSDITEELVRLDSHFSQLGALLDSPEPVGRKLDFLLQEVGREVNTIGSKSQHAPVAHLVVDMKSEVERLREQVQNVE